MGRNGSGLLKDCFWNIYTNALLLLHPHPSQMGRTFSLRLKSGGCSPKKMLLRGIQGSESGCGYPELYFGIMKRDVLPAPCQDTRKRACQSTCPYRHTHFLQSALSFREKVWRENSTHIQKPSNPCKLLYSATTRYGNKMPNNYSVAKKHKKFISLLQAILFMDGSSHESRKLSHNQLVVFRVTSASERGKEVMEESCTCSCKHSPKGGSLPWVEHITARASGEKSLAMNQEEEEQILVERSQPGHRYNEGPPDIQ